MLVLVITQAQVPHVVMFLPVPVFAMWHEGLGSDFHCMMLKIINLLKLMSNVLSSKQRQAIPYMVLYTIYCQCTAVLTVYSSCMPDTEGNWL